MPGAGKWCRWRNGWLRIIIAKSAVKMKSGVNIVLNTVQLGDKIQVMPIWSLPAKEEWTDKPLKAKRLLG